MLVVGATLFVVMLAVARGLKAAGRVVGRFVGRFLPARAATVVGGLVVALVAYVLVTGVATDRLLADPRCDVHGGQRRVLHRRPRARRAASSPAVRGRR